MRKLQITITLKKKSKWKVQYVRPEQLMSAIVKCVIKSVDTE